MTLKEIFFADFLWIFKGLQGIAKFLSRGHGQSVFNGGHGQPVFQWKSTGGPSRPEGTENARNAEEHRRPVIYGSHIWKSTAG